MYRFLTLLCFFYFSAIQAGTSEEKLTQTSRSLLSTPGTENIVVIFGASYAKGWMPDSIAGLNVINKGISGNETSDMIVRYEVDVLKHKPKAVIIWGFVNDIFRAKPGEMDTKITALKENFTKMVAMAKTNGIVPVLATEVTITYEDSWKEKIMRILGKLRGKKSYDEYVNEYVKKTNIWLKDYAAAEKIFVLDFEKLLSNDDGSRKREFASEDGSHLTQKAYDAITEHVGHIELNL